MKNYPASVYSDDPNFISQTSFVKSSVTIIADVLLQSVIMRPIILNM